MKVVAIIQARMGSTRLPGKSMLPLGGKPLIQNLLERVTRATKLDEVVLAVPGTSENECLWQCAHDAGVQFYWYRGDENDLVGRYLACAKSFGAEVVVRIPGDNPCVEARVVDEAVGIYMKSPCVFFSNTTHYARLPYEYNVDGIGAEVLSYSRLQWLDQETQGDPKYREHPHLRFGNLNYGAHLRLDVNDMKDYEFVKSIYDFFNHNRFTVEEVLGYLDSKKVTVG